MSEAGAASGHQQSGLSDSHGHEGRHGDILWTRRGKCVHSEHGDGQTRLHVHNSATGLDRRQHATQQMQQRLAQGAPRSLGECVVTPEGTVSGIGGEGGVPGGTASQHRHQRDAERKHIVRFGRVHRRLE